MEPRNRLLLSPDGAAHYSSALDQKASWNQIATGLLLAAAWCYATSATAGPIPSATTQAAGACGQVTAATVPAPFGVTASCDHTVATSRGSTQTIVSSMASLGPGFPLVGALDVHATSISEGVILNEDALTSGSANVTYYFQPVGFRLPPFMPSNIPVFFEARAEGHSDVGVLELIATVSGLGLEQNVNWTFYGETGGVNGSFDNQTVLSDATVSGPLENGALITVSLDAVCGAGAFTTLGESATDTCKAVVDPIIEFDQAAFDATYGSRAFQLSDYFNLDFSPNVPTAGLPVPEPTSYALMLFGLATIFYRTRQGRRFKI